MTLAEFKAWFEGFTEDLEGAPNEKQFAKIKQRVAEIDGTPVNPVVIREYIRPYWHGPYYGPVYGSSRANVLLSAGSSGDHLQIGANGTPEWATVDEMKALGTYDSMMV